MKECPLLEENGVRFKVVNPVGSQKMFEHISERARSRGMLVNEKKTGLVCVSAAKSFKAKASLMCDGEKVESTKSTKLLGFVFDTDAGAASQAASVAARLRSRTWSLPKLKKCGLTEQELTCVYATCIRPVAEYDSVVLHPMLTDEQTVRIERQQNQALKMIFGDDISAKKMRKKAGLDSLGDRRLEACRKFAKNSINNPRCG